VFRFVAVVNPDLISGVFDSKCCVTRSAASQRANEHVMEGASMIRRTLLATTLAAIAAAAAAFAPVASARTAWSVSIGAPGFAVSAGEPYAYAPAYRPYWRHHHYYRYYAPPVVYAPAPVYMPPRVVYHAPYVPAPVYRPYPYYYPY
jgi:hypothetical protein